MPESVLEWGIALIISFQSLGDWLIGPMNAFTFTGYVEFYLVVMPALYWCYDHRLGFRLGIALMLSIYINSIFKTAIHDPRPYWVTPQVRLLAAPEPTFGIPSGHAQNAVVLWSMLAIHIKKGWVWILLITLAIFVGISRMYLGVHFPTDVFVGWGLGIILLLLFLRLERPTVAVFKQWSEKQQIGAIFVLSLVVVGFGAWIINGASATFKIPTEWLENIKLVSQEPITPFFLDDLITGAATFFGLISGFIWLETRGSFDARGPWQKRVGRYIIGIIGLFLIWRGLGLFFRSIAHDASLLGYILRYIRYGLIGIWASALGPLIFIRWGLAEKGHAKSR